MSSNERRRWTEDEIMKLKSKYPNADLDALSEELGRSIRAIVCKAEEMNVARIRNNTVIEGRKFCSLCKKFHDVSEFYRNKAKLDGYEYYCKRYYAQKEKRNSVSQKSRYKFTPTPYEYTGVNRERIVHEKREIIIIDGLKHKECTECFEWLPLHEYRNQAKAVAGKAPKCIFCDTMLYHLRGRDYDTVKEFELEQRKERAELKAKYPKMSDEELIKKARVNVKARYKESNSSSENKANATKKKNTDKKKKKAKKKGR